jgi:hypothetical protein
VGRRQRHDHRPTLIADSHTLGFTVDGVDNDGNDWDAGGNISWHYNFFAGGNRTPKMGGFNGVGTVQNNLVQSNGSKLTTVVYGTPRINVVGNYYQIETASLQPNRFQPIGSSTPSIYTGLNFYENENGVVLKGGADEDNSVIWIRTTGGPIPPELFADRLHSGTLNPPPMWAASSVAREVLSNVGATHYLNDEDEPAYRQSAYDAEAAAYYAEGNLRFRRYASDWTPRRRSHDRAPIHV